MFHQLCVCGKKKTIKSTILAIFMCSSVASSTSTELGNHHHPLSLEIFIFPN